MSKMVWLIIFVLAILLIGLYVDRYQNNAAKKRIVEAVTKKGGSSIHIISKGSDGESNIRLYTVGYTIPSGKRHVVDCQVSANGLFWRGGLPMGDGNAGKIAIIDQLTQENETLQQQLAHKSASTSKEQIIDDLTAENARLRAQLEAANK